MDIRTVIGKRVLLSLKRGGYGYPTQVDEYRILEVSPSGQWVKLMNLHGNKFWRPIAEASLVEELIEFKPSEPSPTS